MQLLRQRFAKITVDIVSHILCAVFETLDKKIRYHSYYNSDLHNTQLLLPTDLRRQFAIFQFYCF